MEMSVDDAIRQFNTWRRVWLVKTKRRPVFSLKTLLSMNGRELRE